MANREVSTSASAEGPRRKRTPSPTPKGTPRPTPKGTPAERLRPKAAPTRSLTPSAGSTESSGSLPSDLFSANVDFHGDLVRNIPGIRTSQHLFDDLSSDPADWSIAIAAEGTERIPTPSALITRPFDYGTVISYSFDSAHWQATRYSDGTRFGVWYGSTDVETTVYETAWHWYRFVRDSYPEEDREIRTDRRVFDTRCDGLLVDLRGREAAHPELVSRGSYAFTQRVGRYLHEQSQNGLLAKSARCDGTNAAILRRERLSNVRDKLFLGYRLNPKRNRFVAQRAPGRAWLSFAPSTLG